jgi:hypothetical protein
MDEAHYHLDSNDLICAFIKLIQTEILVVESQLEKKSTSDICTFCPRSGAVEFTPYLNNISYHCVITHTDNNSFLGYHKAIEIIADNSVTLPSTNSGDA